MRSVYELVLLRWRTAQWFLALADGDLDQARAILAVMRVEGLTRADSLDEFRLLRDEFGRRPRYRLVAEIARLARKLGVAS
ncbi:hypothetical protein GR927_35930 [Mycolicibacterium sp. 3033]|nr:hypothetical protein [Mycolicibacterium aurantiacum]